MRFTDNLRLCLLFIRFVRTESKSTDKYKYVYIRFVAHMQEGQRRVEVLLLLWVD